MSHKNFQHFINWFDIFIRAKTNIKKKKGKIKQKIKGKAYLAPRAKPAHPAQPVHRGSGVFFPLPRTQAARWNATKPARASFSRLETPWSTPPPPSSPHSPVSSPPEEHAGAPSSTRVAINAEKPQERVQALRRRRLRRTAEGIEPGARIGAGFFLE